MDIDTVGGWSTVVCAQGNLGTFRLRLALNPGLYRARLKLSWDLADKAASGLGCACADLSYHPAVCMTSNEC